MTDDFAAAAQATAEWWASKVFGPLTVQPISSHDDRSAGDAMLMMAFAQAVAPPAEPPKDKRGEYVEAVARVIEQGMGYGSTPHVTILTDMGAPIETRSIDERLGIHGGRYPMKTMSSTSPDHVVVYVGYHGQPQIVWQAEGWEPPPCGQGAWDLSKPNGGRLPWKCSAPKYHPHNEHVFDVPSPLCIAPSRYPGREACNMPENDYHHTCTDDYMSRWVHDFVPGEVKPMTPRQRKAVNA